MSIKVNSVPMKRFLFFFSIATLLVSLYYTDKVKLTLNTIADSLNHTSQETHMSAKNTMAQVLSHAKIVKRPSGERGHANHGWLNSYHTFSFAGYYDPRFQNFGALRVLNEDRVAPESGFPTHPHRDAEIFSYILSGELTHRDSMVRPGGTSANKDDFYRMHRGDVQFTTGGKGIAHSEENEHKKDTVHFLQIWALPWKRGLPPTYHTSTFEEADKRKGFVKIISPLKAGPNASLVEEKEAVPTIPGTIPIHADLLFGAAIIPKGDTFTWKIGADDAVSSKTDRKTYIHVPMTKGGKAKIRLAGRDESILSEGDGAFVSNVKAGDLLSFESIGEEEAEVVVLDSN